MKIEKSGTKTVTQNDVAREAGVTRSIVSYVINGNSDRSVAPETRKKILDAIDKLGYRPNKAAQALQQGDIEFASNRIGVVISDPGIFSRPYYSEILSGIHTAAHENNYHVTFIRFFDELKDPVLFNELIHEEEVGGLILLATDLAIRTDADRKIIDRIHSRLKRVVTIEWEHPGISSVWFDRAETSYKACDYLFRKGYSDIAYIGEMDERITGVQKFLEEHGYDTSSLLIEAAFNLSSGYEAAHRLFTSLRKLPEAVVCGSDEVAIGILRYFNEHHVEVPARVALISIDNIEVSRYTNPPLTTINVQKRLMGARAVEMIVMGKNKDWRDPEIVYLPTTIVERDSC